jgi:hypothetical protein
MCFKMCILSLRNICFTCIQKFINFENWYITLHCSNYIAAAYENVAGGGAAHAGLHTPLIHWRFQTSHSALQESRILSACKGSYLLVWSQRLVLRKLLLLLLLYSPLLGLGRFFSFLILYTVGTIPWTGDQPVARPLPIHRTTQTE